MGELVPDVAETVWYTDDSSSPLTVVKPAAFAEGQLLIAVIVHDAASGLADLTGPAHWTDEGNYSVSGSQGRVWSHIYEQDAVSEPASYDFGYNAGAACVLGLFRITNADVTTPTVVVASRGYTSCASSEDSPSVTPTAGNDLLICTMSIASTGTAMTETDPATMSDLGQDQLLSQYMALAGAKQQLFDPSATGVRTWTNLVPLSRAGGTFSIAIKSSGLFDPDPPRWPPAPLMPPWLLRELVAHRSRSLLANHGAPTVKQTLSGGTSGTNITFTTADTTDVGDLLVVFHGDNFYTAAGLLAPTGTAGTWTERALGDNGTNSVHMKVWTRLVTVPGAQTVTCTPNSPNLDNEHTAHLLVIAGADPIDPVDVAAGNNGAASISHVAPGVTTTTANDLLLCGVQSNATGTYTPPGKPDPMSEVTEFTTPGFITGTTARMDTAIVGAQGTRAFITSISATFASVTIAIRPVQPVVAGGGEDFTGDSIVEQRATTDTTGAMAGAATTDAPQCSATTAAGARTATIGTQTAQRATTAATGVKNAAGTGATTQRSTDQTNTLKQANAGTTTTTRTTSRAEGAPGMPTGPGNAPQRSTTTTTTRKEAAAPATAPQRTSVAATGRKQATAAGAPTGHNTSATTGRKQATTTGTATGHPTTQATTATIPGGPGLPIAHPTTTSTGKATKTSAPTPSARTSSTSTGRATTAGTGRPTARTHTLATGQRGTSGTAAAALRCHTTSTGQEVLPFTPAYVTVEATSSGPSLDGSTSAGGLDATTVAAGLLDG